MFDSYVIAIFEKKKNINFVAYVQTKDCVLKISSLFFRELSLVFRIFFL